MYGLSPWIIWFLVLFAAFFAVVGVIEVLRMQSIESSP